MLFIQWARKDEWYNPDIDGINRACWISWNISLIYSSILKCQGISKLPPPPVSHLNAGQRGKEARPLAPPIEGNVIELRYCIALSGLTPGAILCPPFGLFYCTWVYRDVGRALPASVNIRRRCPTRRRNRKGFSDLSPLNPLLRNEGIGGWSICCGYAAR